MELADLEIWIWLAGLGQIVLIIGSVAIPKVLQWREKLQVVDNLTRQMFWVYSIYIWGTNLWFGLISMLGASWLVDGSPLSGAVNTFIAIYWGARVIIQFAYFDRSELPSGTLYTLGEFALVSLFIALTVIYGLAAFLSFA